MDPREEAQATLEARNPPRISMVGCTEFKGFSGICHGFLLPSPSQSEENREKSVLSLGELQEDHQGRRSFHRAILGPSEPCL